MLEDAIERSLSLAASMDARGYGRRSAVPAGSRVLASASLFGGLMGLLVGVYCLLDTTTPRWLGVPMLVAGSAAAVLGLAAAGRRVQRSRYRPDRWLPPEIATVAAGAAVAASFVWCGLSDPSVLTPTVSPPTWPTVTALPIVGLALALLPAVLTPPPPATRAPVDVPVRAGQPSRVLS